MKKQILILIAMLSVIACKDPYQDDTFTPYDIKPAGAYLETRSETFSEWIELLKYTDLFNASNQSSVKYTFAVPTNKAMGRFLEANNIASVYDLDLSYAKTLVKFHILSAEVSENTFLEGGRLNIASLSNDYWEISFTEEVEENQGYILINNEATIIENAHTTTNGLVYVIGDVLSPLVETVYDRIKENSKYSIFAEAVEKTGWNEALSVVIDSTEVPGFGSIATYRNYTTFVVSDDTYAKLNINDLPSLSLMLEVKDDNYTNPENALYQYVAYHIMSAASYTHELFTYQEGDTAAVWSTLANNKVFSTTINSAGERWINYGEDAGVKLIEGSYDIVAKNGVLHEVNNYMPITEPNPLTVVWDLTASDDIASLVNSYGAARNLGELYQTLRTTGYYVTYNKHQITSASWTAEQTANLKVPQVSYYMASDPEGYGVDDVYSYVYRDPSLGGLSYSEPGAMNHDFLALNLGANGRIKLKTPVLVKGSYSVTIHYGFNNNIEELASGGSLTKFSFGEDAVIYPSLYNGAALAWGAPKMNNMVLTNKIDFEETTALDLEIVLLDPRASTYSNYLLLLDRIVFTPI